MEPSVVPRYNAALLMTRLPDDPAMPNGPLPQGVLLLDVIGRPARHGEFLFVAALLDAPMGGREHRLDLRLVRQLSEEPKAPKPRRASHEKVIENLERWANSPGLQPPESPEAKTA